MGSNDHRSEIGTLSDDFRWLEDYCRRDPDLTPHAGTIHLASALARNVIGPFLEGQPAKPLHIAVVGGAGAGKSTVVNFLAGQVVAEANAQAGFTRHPTAFVAAGQAAPLPSFSGFMGTLQRLSGEMPADTDEDVYQVRRLAQVGQHDNPLADFVIWDCPDMTTWAATGYVNRLMEVAALADLVIYVASDERYNDEVPTQFLHQLIRAGKALIVVLTKVKDTDAATLTEHFRREILGRLPHQTGAIPNAVPIVILPQIPPAMRADPAGAGVSHRVGLLNQVLFQCGADSAARMRTVRNAATYLRAASDGLLEVARRDLAEYDSWKSAVMAGKADFEERYRNEFLSGEQFHSIDRSQEELMDLLELPGAGRVLGGLTWLLRTPYRWTRDYVAGLLARPVSSGQSETAVLSAAFTGWLDRLQAETLRRAPVHGFWKQLAARFDSELSPQARELFEADRRTLELKETDDLARAGKALVDGLANRAVLLNTIRIGLLLIDLAVVAAILYFTWVPSWYHILLIFVGVSLTHQFAELIVRGLVESTRHRVRNRRETFLKSELTDPLAAWLAEWPATGGSSIEKLQQVLRRIPESIRRIEESVLQKTGQPLVAPTPSRPPESE